MSLDAFEQLKRDHINLKDVMQEMEQAINNSSDETKELFDKFMDLFQDHAHKVDKIVYPILKNHNQLSQHLLTCYQAHQIAKAGIIKLSLLSQQNESWGPKFLITKDYILHVNEEEDRLFEDANEVLAESELQKINHALNKELEKNKN